MIFLHKKQFLPAMILISVIFLPFIIAMLTFCFTEQSLKLLPFIGVLLLIYAGLIFYVAKTSTSKKNYLIVNKDGLDICCNNQYCDPKTRIWNVPYHSIHQLDYYKITSFRGWCILYSYLLPKCVFITIGNGSGKKNAVFIGYMDLHQIKSIAEQGNIKLVIH